MEFKVVGIERRSGEYEGKAYDNTLVHCLYASDKCSEGVAVATIKVNDNLGVL